MKVAVVGAGPAGLYLGILLAKAGSGHEVTVYERNPADATFGWGVVFSQETLGALRDADLESYLEITDSFARWDAIDISYRDRVLRCRGHAFSAIARKRLLGILQARAAHLGVKQQFGADVSGAADLAEVAADADLVVGADGVHSAVRRAYPDAFGTTVSPQGCKYVWFGTDLVFDAFRFIFAQTEHGLFQVHAYPFDESTSTFIVECPEDTWRAAGLDTMTESESISFCLRLFADDLRGHRLLSNKSQWLSFPLVRNRVWQHREGGTPLALIGDAAHTAHFTIGSGTKLAMEDAIALAGAFVRHGHGAAEIPAALTHYEQERQPVVERFQQAAGESADYFARVRHHADLPPPQFAFNLLTRSGRIGHANLALRDADFVRGVDSWFATAGATTRRVCPPPAFTPLRLRGLRLPNRVASARPQGGEGLVLGGFVAVAPDGRITPRTPMLPDCATRLRDDVATARAAGAEVSALIGHAGRRGATRDPARGVDVPLPAADAWPLFAPSPLPYGPGAQTPRAMDADDMDRLREAFAAAARAAADAGVGMLELDCAHGRLLASFLSPLTNHRDDDHGGSPENRLRYPLRVFDAVRAAWPDERPLAVRLTVADWARGGLTTDDGVLLARAFAAAGADIIHVVAGQNVAECTPDYRRGFLTALSDRMRSEADVATIVGGHLTTVDAINTVLAAARADLCVATFPAAGLEMS